jgi:hypothetical protein
VERDELASALGRWVDAGLIDEEHAAAIRGYEAEVAGPPRRLPPVAEAIADVGIVLGLAAAAVLWATLARDQAHGARLVLSVGITIALLVGGGVVRRSTEPRFGRIASTLWLLGSLSIGLVVLDAYIASTGEGREVPSVVGLAAGVPIAAAGWITHAFDRRVPTMVGAFVGTLTTGIGLLVWLLEDASAAATQNAIAAMLAAIGTAWLAAAIAGRLRPSREAGLLGVAPILVAPIFLVDRRAGTALLLGVAASAMLMAIGIRLPGWSVMVVSAVGLFGYLTGTLVYFFEDSLGVPLVLLIAAVLMIALAVAVVRLRRPPEDPTP